MKSKLTKTAAVALAGLSLAPATSLAGNREWWGYRTNSSETYALATQSADVMKSRIPYFSLATSVMALSWKWNAQGARSIGKCTGINWAGTPMYVGCSNR